MLEKNPTLICAWEVFQFLERSSRNLGSLWIMMTEQSMRTISLAYVDQLLFRATFYADMQHVHRMLQWVFFYLFSFPSRYFMHLFWPKLFRWIAACWWKLSFEFDYEVSLSIIIETLKSSEFSMEFFHWNAACIWNFFEFVRESSIPISF